MLRGGAGQLLGGANGIPARGAVFTICGAHFVDTSAACFQFPVVAGDVPYATVCCSCGPMLALFDPSDTRAAFDDGSGPGLMPYFACATPASGLWTIAVTRWPGWGCDGGCAWGWSYAAAITLRRPAGSEISKPATWDKMAAGLAALLALRCP